MSKLLNKFITREHLPLKKFKHDVIEILFDDSELSTAHRVLDGEQCIDLTDEEIFVQQYARNCVDGDPEQVKAKLQAISERYETTDLSVVTICHSYQDRVKSYELVANAFDLS